MCALYVFDKMPKWHFVVVLDSNEYQILGITIIIHVYHDLIIGGVFYALCPINPLKWGEKKNTLEEYYKTKVDIECVFLFLLNSKTKYTFQTPIVNHIYIIYKAHKSTTSDLNIKS